MPIEIEDLGRAAYAPTLEHMRALHARVANGEDAGRILIVEHDPVYTAGRATPACGSIICCSARRSRRA